MSIEDAGVADSIAGSVEASDDVPQAVLDHIEETFAGKSDSLEQTGNETVSVPAKEIARRETVKKEQQSELVEQGLASEDAGVDPDAEPTETEAAGDETAEEGAEQAGEEPAGEPIPDLDPNLRFAAQHVGGLKDEEINELYQQNPTLASRIFENYLSAFSAMSRQTGLLPTQSPQPVQQATQRPQAPTSKIDQLIANIKEFSETNGEPLGEFVQALHNEVIAPFRQMQAELMVQKQQMIAAEATNTTNALAEKFSDVYGQGDKLNLMQQTNRQKLYEVADQLRTGAYQQGHEMSVKDAINRAHLIITADKQVAFGRQQVQKQIQKRSRQITARPTQRVKPTAPGQAKGELTAVEAYRQRAAELGMDIGD